MDFGEADIIGENEDVVRLMTIHKSKGLEFPVVFENVYISLLFLKDTSAWCGILDEHLFSQHIKGCPCFLVFYC